MGKRKPATKTPRKTQKNVQEKFEALAQEGPEKQQWPEDVPLTREYMELASDSFWLYHEGWSFPLNSSLEKRDWIPVDEHTQRKTAVQVEYRDECRELAKYQPNCRRAINLYGYYILGGQFRMEAAIRDEENASPAIHKVKKKIDQLWESAVEANAEWWTPYEMAIRAYRDGDGFTQRFTDQWPVQFRFVDPETIAGEGQNEYLGIETDPKDVARVNNYLLYDLDLGKVVARIPAADMYHVKVDADSTERRGRPRLLGVIPTAKHIADLITIEVVRRKLQASIVMVRKVKAGAGAARRIRDHAESGTSSYSDTSLSREKIRPGTIITQSEGIETEFVQPANDFSDASPLFKILWQQLAVATGWTYEQVSGDISSGNLATALVNESPTYQMVLWEREFMGRTMKRIFRDVVELAISKGKLDGVDAAQVWEIFQPVCRFPNLVTRDPLQEAQVITHGIQNGTMSRSEGSRRQGLDPQKMHRELEEENALGIFMNVAAMQPGMDDKAASSGSNAKAAGSNQGQGGTTRHSDRKGDRDGTK